MKIHITIIALFMSCLAMAQVDYDARTVNEPYEGVFRPGINLGYWEGWSQKDLGDLVVGAGGKVVRPVLSESVLEIFGYDLLIDEFEYWEAQGMGNFTATLGFPVDWHKDWTEYCPGKPSTMFANMYTPIWDDGENGTPYNDENYFAAYVYKCVTTYTKYVDFWEIWNQPGFDETFNLGWRDPGDPVGNWWDQDPDPCDYILKAPIEHYVRTLRIAYEVIKTVAPEDKVMAGGFGFQSFLDAVLRNTDNPFGGGVTDEYPLGGGAYFEVFVIHNYPHFDGSLKDPDGSLHRHSDRAAQGLVYRKNFFQEIYNNYGYDGVTYPAKQHLATEMNVPRAFDEDPNLYFATEVGQRNYLMKSFVTAQLNKILQFHVYSLVDKPGRPFGFDKMGLWQDIIGVQPGNAVINPEGIAMRTTSDMLWETEYDAEQTAAMNVPEGVEGHAFLRQDGRYIYMMWAKTSIDQSEFAEATYSFPEEIGIDALDKMEWDFFQTQNSEVISANGIALDATPIFLLSDITGNFLIISCVDDIEVEAAIGETSVVVNWTAPVVNSNCAQGFEEAVQISGPESGSDIPVGIYEIEYEATSECGQTRTCSFEVEVLEPNTDCFSSGIAPWNEWIAGVQFSNINNESGKCDPSCGYGNFTDQVGEALRGETYTLTLTPGISYPTYPTDLYWSVWIDFNGDGYFSNLEEKVFEEFGGNQPLITDLMINEDWPVGQKVMRISASKGSFADPCADIALGEVEDYTIDITDGALACNFQVALSVENCYDNNSEYDPNDDYYYMDLSVLLPGQSENFTVTSPAGTSTHAYGTPISIGPFPTESGLIDVSIADSENPTCRIDYAQVGWQLPCSAAQGPACNDNLLENQSFENGQGWVFWFYAYETAQEVSGNQGIEIAEKNHRVYQWLDVEPGAAYSLNGYAKMSNANAMGKVGIRFLNNNWQELGTAFIDITTEVYVPMTTLMAFAPSGATIMEVSAINLSSGSSMYIDDFCLMKLPGGISENISGSKGAPLQLDATANRQLFGKKIQAFPNPANDYVNLDFGLVLTTAAQLRVLDGLGQLIYQNKLDGDRQWQLSTSQWASGIYFVELVTEAGEQFVEKVIVE